jgi:hypothetical protein
MVLNLRLPTAFQTNHVIPQLTESPHTDVHGVSQRSVRTPFRAGIGAEQCREVKLDPLGSVKRIGKIDRHAGPHFAFLNPSLEKPPTNSLHTLAAQLGTSLSR